MLDQFMIRLIFCNIILLHSLFFDSEAALLFSALLMNSEYRIKHTFFSSEAFSSKIKLRKNRNDVANNN